VIFHEFDGVDRKEGLFSNSCPAGVPVMQIDSQAGQNSVRVAAIQALYEEMKRAIHEATHSQYTVHILDAIVSKPIFRSSDLAEKLNLEYGIHEKTALGLLRQIRDAGILRELQSGSGRRPATLGFPRLINLAEGREVF
jgi:hypothetical protein